MPKTDLVSCFYWGQDSETSEPAMVLFREEVRILKNNNQGFFIDHGKNFRLIAEDPVAARTSELVEKSSGESDPCISFEEMQANVGIVRDGLENERGLIQTAQEKIRWYPHIRTYPELASGRWAQLA